MANVFQRLNIVNNIDDRDGEETGSETLSISQLDNGILFSSRTKLGPLLVHAASEHVRNPMKHNPLHTSFFYKNKKVFCASYIAFTRNAT